MCSKIARQQLHLQVAGNAVRAEAIQAQADSMPAVLHVAKGHSGGQGQPLPFIACAVNSVSTSTCAKFIMSND